MKSTLCFSIVSIASLYAISVAQNTGNIEQRLKNAAKSNPCPSMDEKCVSAVTCEYTSWIRKAAGKKPVTSGADDMRKNAMKHTKDMVARRDLFHQDIMSVRPGRGDCQVDIGGENVAFNFGESNPMAECALQWLKSPGHYQNMINSDFEQCAVAVVKDGERYYCTQTFSSDAPKKECGASGMGDKSTKKEPKAKAEEQPKPERKIPERRRISEKREQRMKSDRSVTPSPEVENGLEMDNQKPNSPVKETEKLQEKRDEKDKNSDTKEKMMEGNKGEKQIKSKTKEDFRRKFMFESIEVTKTDGKKMHIVQMCKQGNCLYCWIGDRSRRCLDPKTSLWIDHIFKYVFWI